MYKSHYILKQFTVYNLQIHLRILCSTYYTFSCYIMKFHPLYKRILNKYNISTRTLYHRNIIYNFIFTLSITHYLHSEQNQSEDPISGRSIFRNRAHVPWYHFWQASLLHWIHHLLSLLPPHFWQQSWNKQINN